MLQLVLLVSWIFLLPLPRLLSTSFAALLTLSLLLLSA